MTSKQSRFIDEYMVDLNANQAAIRAGYLPKTARFQGSFWDLLNRWNGFSAITGFELYWAQGVGQHVPKLVAKAP